MLWVTMYNVFPLNMGVEQCKVEIPDGDTEVASSVEPIANIKTKETDILKVWRKLSVSFESCFAHGELRLSLIP